MAAIFRLIQMIQRTLNQQVHAVGHAADRQGNRAAGIVHLVGESCSDGADPQHVFRGVGEQGFGVEVVADSEERSLAFFGFCLAGREVMVKGALGRFVERR